MNALLCSALIETRRSSGHRTLTGFKKRTCGSMQRFPHAMCISTLRLAAGIKPL
jgi:hypothetical protein